MDDASDLTLGGVVCGNPSKALRSRAKTRIHTPDSKQEHKDKLFAKVSSAPNFELSPSSHPVWVSNKKKGSLKFMGDRQLANVSSTFVI